MVICTIVSFPIDFDLSYPGSTVCIHASAFKIIFKANQTFGLTGSEISQSEPKLARPKAYFYHCKGCNK